MQFTEKEMNQIKTLLEEKGLLYTKDLKAIGVNQYRIRKAIEIGIFKKKATGKYVLNINHKAFLDKSFESQLNKEIKAGNFKTALDMLREENSRQPLRRYYRIILELLEDIITIERTGILPVPSPCPTHDIYDLIQHRDFVRADKENDLHAKRNCSRGEYTLIGRLLKHIVLYIQKPQKKEKGFTNDQDKNERLENEFTSTPPQSDSLVEMLTKLINGEIEVPLAIMRNHLKISGLSEYDYLIEALIRISVATNEMTFHIPMTTLASLKAGKQIEVFKYISDYKAALEANLPIVAQLYLSIIYMAISRGHSDLSIEEIQQLLNDKMAPVKDKHSISRSKGRTIKLNEVTK